MARTTGHAHLGLSRTPYFLKLLCDQVEAHKAVPKGRASLFTGFVCQVLEREITGESALFHPDIMLTDRDHQKLTLKQWRSPFELPERGTLIPSLGRLAYAMQEKGLQTEGAQVRIAYDDACHLLQGERQKDILKAGVALNVPDEDLAQDQILFFHQLLQEFFAARKLAGHPKPDLVRAERQARKVSPTLQETLPILADSDPLPLLPQTGWEETTLLASVMARDPAASIRARMAAGLALGVPGDPRIERRTGPQGEYLLPPLVTIPVGEYPMGSEEGVYDDEAPAHTVRLVAFQIGVFPVTNAEYALLIASGGHKDERWWRAYAAKAWSTGEGSSEVQRYTEPEDWNDETFNNPSQPVVGIGWRDAWAYCAWLSVQVGRAFRLPTEAEFEAAARGTAGRRYPYGDMFDSVRSNTFENHIPRTTPVGIFRNATPEGVFDLSGNVLTWTSSAHQPYPYRASDGREDLGRTDVPRVIRGGSWYLSQVSARGLPPLGLRCGLPVRLLRFSGGGVATYFLILGYREIHFVTSSATINRPQRAWLTYQCGLEAGDPEKCQQSQNPG